MSETQPSPTTYDSVPEGKRVELYNDDLPITGDRVPDDAITTDAIEQQIAHEAEETPAEKLERLEEELALKRNALVRAGATRGKRGLARKNGKTTERYDLAHGAYTKSMQDLIRAKLELDDQYKDLSDREKKFQAMHLMDQDWKEVRDGTNKNLEGTITGKLVKWLGKEDQSKVKRMSKLLLLGAGTAVVAAGVGAATGGVGFGAIAGIGASAGLRGYRGYVSNLSSNGGRALADHEMGAQTDLAYDENTSLEDLLHAGTSDSSYTDSIVEKKAESRKALKKSALITGLGTTAGAAFDYFNVGDKAMGVWGSMTSAGDAAQSVQGPNLNVDKPAGADGNIGTRAGENPNISLDGSDAAPADAPGSTGALLESNGEPNSTAPRNAREAEERIWAEKQRFTYNPDDNPFFAEGKTGIHAMGPGLIENAELDNGIPGLHDLVENRWVDSPEQFASVVSAMGIDNLPGDIQSAEDLAEHFKVTPSAHAEMHSEVLGILDQDSTNITIEPIENSYQSEYGVDAGNGDVRLGWDNEVDQRGTKIVIEFEDPNTHEMRKIELRTECGGQRIVENPPAPVYDAPAAPQQSYEQPTYSQPPESNPPTGTPPESEPPVGEPPVDVPPEEEEPPIDNPPEDTPKSADPNEYQVPGRDGGTHSGEGSFIPTGPGAFTAPPQVEQVLPDSPAPDRGPNIATPGPESSSRTPGSETSVSAGRDDADSGVAGGPVNDRSGADADNKPKNGKVSGPAA